MYRSISLSILFAGILLLFGLIFSSASSANNFAPWGYGNGQGHNNAQQYGNANSEGQSQFGMDMRGRGNSVGDFRGNSANNYYQQMEQQAQQYAYPYAPPQTSNQMPYPIPGQMPNQMPYGPPTMPYNGMPPWGAPPKRGFDFDRFNPFR
jgi:hypothetical protein